MPMQHSPHRSERHHALLHRAPFAIASCVVLLGLSSCGRVLEKISNPSEETAIGERLGGGKDDGPSESGDGTGSPDQPTEVEPETAEMIIEDKVGDVTDPEAPPEVTPTEPSDDPTYADEVGASGPRLLLISSQRLPEDRVARVVIFGLAESSFYNNDFYFYDWTARLTPLECANGPCEEGAVTIEGEFNDEAFGTPNTEDITHAFPSDTLRARIDIDVKYANEEDVGLVLRESFELTYREPDPSEGHVIEAPKELETLPISDDGVLESSLHIEGVRDLRDLDALSGLREVRGDLTIASNLDLRSMEGLNNLEKVTGKLTVEHNWKAGLGRMFTSLIEAGSVQAGGYHDHYHPSIFPALEKTGTLTLREIADVSHVDIENLSDVEEVWIVDNANVERINIGALQATMVHLEKLVIERNAWLSSVYLSNALTSIGNFTLVGNQSYNDLDGFEAVESIDTFLVSSNANLYSMSGLNGLISVGSLVIRNNPKLLSLAIDLAFPNLSDVTRRLIVRDNANLAACSARQFANRFTPSEAAIVENNTGTLTGSCD